VDKEGFNARVDTFINNIKNARVAEGHEEIFLPGEHPAPRDLARMTNCDTTSKGEGLRG
jgi:hypothetical protein